MNNLHCLNRSRSGFLNCVSCRKGKWGKCQSPSSLQSFGRGIAVSIKERVGEVYPVQAPQGLEPFYCCRQPWLNSWVSLWSQAEESMTYISSAPLCRGVLCALVFLSVLAGTDHSHSCDSLKLRQRVGPNITSFCFAGDHDSTAESRQCI